MKKARERMEREEREKDDRENRAAERRGVNARAAVSAAPKKTKPPATPAKLSDESDDSRDDNDETEEEKNKGDAAEEEDEEEDDSEVEEDLDAGDDSCRRSRCGLSAGTAKWNCAQHEKAAREQASNDAGPSGARRERPAKGGNGGDGTSVDAPPRKKKKQQAKGSFKLNQKAAEEVMANAMALYMQQFQALAQLSMAQKVCPISTGYIR